MRRHFLNTFALILCVVFILSGFFVINNKSVVNNNNNSKKGHGKEVGNYVSSTKSSASGKKFTMPRKKHVTKSLNELPPMDHLNAHVLFLNTIPKSGAEVLVLLLKWLQGQNSFKHVRLKKETNRKLTVIQQENLIYEIEDILRNEAIPVSFDKEVRFVNFSLIGKQSPTFFTLIRNPEELIIARYPKNSTTDFIKNCTSTDPGCLINPNYNGLELNIPYFCGYHPRCDSLNDDWALAIAKENVEKFYPVVGVLEEIPSTITCLEQTLPYFFKGAVMMYKKKLLGFNKKKKTPKIKKGDYKYLKKILRAEMAFYEWIKFRLFKDINNKKLF